MDAFIHDPTFWVAVAFVVFVVLIFKPSKGALIGSLDAKIVEIRQEVEEAEKLREEAQSLLANYQRQQRQAIQDAEAIVARAKEEAEAIQAEADAARELAEFSHSRVCQPRKGGGGRPLPSAD